MLSNTQTNTHPYTPLTVYSVRRGVSTDDFSIFHCSLAVLSEHCLCFSVSESGQNVNPLALTSVWRIAAYLFLLKSVLGDFRAVYTVLKLVLIRNIACFVQLLFTSQMQLLSFFF